MAIVDYITSHGGSKVSYFCPMAEQAQYFDLRNALSDALGSYQLLLYSEGSSVGTLLQGPNVNQGPPDAIVMVGDVDSLASVVVAVQQQSPATSFYTLSVVSSVGLHNALQQQKVVGNNIIKTEVIELFFACSLSLVSLLILG